MKNIFKHWYNKLPEIGYQMKPYVKGGKTFLPNRGKGNYNATLYSGRGVKFNGTDQNITMHINDTINTVVFFKNGELVFDETLQTITDYVTDVNSADTYQNFIFYKGIFENYEKEYLRTNPEKFLYHEKQADGTFIAKSEILSQEKIDNVVSHFPMCETDMFVRDMIGYSETRVSGLIDNAPTDDDEVSTYTKNDDTSYDLAVTTAGTNTARPYLAHAFVVSNSAFHYRVSFDVVVNSGTPILTQMYNGKYLAINETLKTGHYEYVMPVGDDSYQYLVKYFDGTNEFDISVTNFRVDELTSTYPIENYTASCNATNLSTGLQTCFWKRDMLGVPVGVPNNGIILPKDLSTSIIRTGYILDDSNSFGIEAILEVFSPRRYGYFNMYPFYFITHVSVDIYLRLNDVSLGTATGVGKHHCYMEYDAVTSNIIIAVNGIVMKTGTVTKYGEYGQLADAYKNNGELPLLNIYTEPQDPAKLYADAVRRGIVPEKLEVH